MKARDCKTDEFACHLGAQAEPSSPRIWAEGCWRKHPGQFASQDSLDSRSLLSRWGAQIQDKPIEVSNENPDSCHIITTYLKDSEAEIRCGAHRPPSRQVSTYDTFVTGPRNVPIRGVFHRSTEVFRVVLPQALVRECYEAVYDRSPDAELSLFGLDFIKDRIVARLMMSLHEIAQAPDSFTEPLIDAASLALGNRLISLHSGRPSRAARQVAALSPGRLRYVTEFIEANLQRPIYLAELSSLAGLSRMHFAAQFKAATRLSPYRFVLHRRIIRAKNLMLSNEHPLVDVALLSGFNSQAHFNQIFRRVTGHTPGEWRRSHCWESSVRPPAGAFDMADALL